VLNFKQKSFSVLYYLLPALLIIFTSDIPCADARHDQMQFFGYQYLSPLPNSKHVSRKSKIILRFNASSPHDILNLQEFIVLKGADKAEYKGTIQIASDQKTVIFTPDEHFNAGEMITVKLNPSFTNNNSGNSIYEYRFKISKEEFAEPVIFPDEKMPVTARLRKSTSPKISGKARILSNGVSVPANFPEIDVSLNNNPDDGLIFINYRRYPRYQLILENSGEPVWYWRVPDDRRDFKAQPNGQLSMMIRDGYGGSGNGYIVLDEHYEYVKTIRATNGYYTDEHELIMLPDSGYFIIGRREEIVDMSAYGKPSNATVRETCIQEYTKNDELIFQWAAWDHFDPADLDYEVNGNDYYIRFPHMNAIFIDEDGHILLSSRHLNEVTKIHRYTGEIIWRLSGQNNQFTFINDDLNGFRSQHAIRAVGNNRYTVFDNGNSHEPPQSRAVEYQIDTNDSTATLVWEFRNDQPQYYSYYMGNAQRLPNGNTLINWAIGELPKLSEITPAGEKAYEMTFADGTHVYRTFKMDWQGMRKTPYLIAEAYTTQVDLIFNKFGDPEAAYYKIYGGQNAQPETVIDTSRTTLKQLTDLENGIYYFRVTAVNHEGMESGYSNEEKINVNLVEPGTNMVLNGDFENGGDHWIWEVSGDARASWEIIDGESHISIADGGYYAFNVQLRQNGIPLNEGQHYILEFDARADNDRVVEIKVAQDSAPWINYSKIGYTAITTQAEHYEYQFTMEEATDMNARVVVNCGGNNSDLYVDNIVVRADVQEAIDDVNHISADCELLGNYPNPFNSQTTIRYHLNQISRIQLDIFDITGSHIKTFNIGRKNPGKHIFTIDTESWSSGVYIYILNTNPDEFPINKKAGKMVLIK